MKSPNTVTAEEFANTVGQANDLIEGCSREILQDLLEIHLRRKFDPKTNLQRVKDQLDELKLMAYFGNVTAVQALSEISLSITGFLNGPRFEDSENLFPSERSDESGDLNRGAFQEAMTSVVNNLIAGGDVRTKKTYDLLKNSTTYVELIDPALAMFTTTIKKYNHEKTDETSAAAVANTKWILHIFLTRRAQRLLDETIEQFASSQTEWPVRVDSADPEFPKNVEEQMKIVGLGKSHPFANMGDGPGRKKSLDLSSPSGMVAHLHKFLEAERISAAALSSSQRAAYQRYEDLLRSDDPSKVLFMDANMHEPWTPITHWKRQAALLEPISGSTIEAWLDAMMSCLSARVSGEGFPNGYLDHLAESPKIRQYADSLGEDGGSVGDAPISPASRTPLDSWISNHKELIRNWELSILNNFSEKAWPERKASKTSKGDIRAALKDALKDALR